MSEASFKPLLPRPPNADGTGNGSSNESGSGTMIYANNNYNGNGRAMAAPMAPYYYPPYGYTYPPSFYPSPHLQQMYSAMPYASVGTPQYPMMAAASVAAPVAAPIDAPAGAAASAPALSPAASSVAEQEAVRGLAQLMRQATPTEESLPDAPMATNNKAAAEPDLPDSSGVVPDTTPDVSDVVQKVQELFQREPAPLGDRDLDDGLASSTEKVHQKPRLCTRLNHFLQNTNTTSAPRSLEIWHGDITDPVDPVDILVISSCLEDYKITCLGSVIRALEARYKDIDVASIAEDCEFDFRQSQRVWISKPLDDMNVPFKRILCVLLREDEDSVNEEEEEDNRVFSPLHTIYDRLFTSICLMTEQLDNAEDHPLSVSIPMIGDAFYKRTLIANNLVRASRRVLEEESFAPQKILLYGYKEEHAAALEEAAVSSVTLWSIDTITPRPMLLSSLSATTSMPRPVATMPAPAARPRLPPTNYGDAVEVCLNDSRNDVILGENDIHGITNSITRFYKEEIRCIFNRRCPTSVDQVLHLFDVVHEIKNPGNRLDSLSFWVSKETAARCEGKGNGPGHFSPEGITVYGRKHKKKRGVLFVRACPECIKNDIKGNRVQKQRNNASRKRNAPDQPDEVPSEEDSVAPDEQVSAPVAAPVPPASPSPKRHKGPESQVSGAFGWLTSFFGRKET